MAAKTPTKAPVAARSTSAPRQNEHDVHAPDADGDSLKERIDKIAAPVSKRLEKPVQRVSRIAAWVRSLKPYRVYINFSHNDGNLMAAGMSYQSLFASFAAVWVGFSIAGIWLGSVPELTKELTSIINRAIPGLIGPDGLIKPDQLPSGLTFGWTGAIAILGLLWTAIAWLYYTRQAVRAMFGLGRDTTNYALQKIRDLGLGFAFGLLLIVSAVVSVLSTEAITFILGALGVDDDSVWSVLSARSVGFLIALLLNFVVLATMFRVLSRVAIPRRNLIFGSLLGSIALSAVSVVGSLIVGAASKNPLLATFAAFIGLLIWFILICRIMLLAASWIAVGMADRNISPRNLTPEQLEEERLAKELNARVIVARAEVAEAEANLATARWFGRLVAQRRVEQARNRLSDILDEGVGRDH